MPVSRNPLRRALDALRGGRLLRRSLPNVLCDLPYGGWLGGSIPPRYLDLGQHSVESTDWADLHALFSHPLTRPRPDDVIVDVGCGKGRALAFLARLTRGRNRIVGLELDPEVAESTRVRMRRLESVEVVPGDAVERFPADGTLVYLANPFAEDVVERFAARLLRGDVALDRLRLVYFNSAYADVFARAGFAVEPLRASMRAVLVHRPA